MFIKAQGPQPTRNIKYQTNRRENTAFVRGRLRDVIKTFQNLSDIYMLSKRVCYCWRLMWWMSCRSRQNNYTETIQNFICSTMDTSISCKVKAIFL